MQVNHLDVVLAVGDQMSPGHSVSSSLAFTLAVISQLPADEKAGLVLSSPGAENTLLFRGHYVRCNRVCYADGQRYKILLNTPEDNGLAWNDDGRGNGSRDYLFIQEGASPPVPAPQGTDYRDEQVRGFVQDCKTLTEDFGRISVVGARMEHDANIGEDGRRDENGNKIPLGYPAARVKQFNELKADLERER